MESQLKQQGAGDRMAEVLEEVPRVRKDAGYPPLVTPSSQIVGTQAVFNVLLGRYKVLSAEFADLMLGYYGETIGPRNPELVAQAAKHAKKQPIDIRPADLLKPEWQELRAAAIEQAGCDGTDEDVLTYAMFPQVAAKFFATRAQGPKNLGKDSLAKAAPAPATAPVPAGSANGSSANGTAREPVIYDVKLNGTTHKVTVSAH
jgi:methylmalonyl-CoA carboxyltransferase 5S subunit